MQHRPDLDIRDQESVRYPRAAMVHAPRVDRPAPLRSPFAMSPCEDKNRFQEPIPAHFAPSATTCAAAGSTWACSSVRSRSNSAPTSALSRTGSSTEPSPRSASGPASFGSSATHPGLPKGPSATACSHSGGNVASPKRHSQAPRRRSGDAWPLGARPPDPGWQVCAGGRGVSRVAEDKP